VFSPIYIYTYWKFQNLATHLKTHSSKLAYFRTNWRYSKNKTFVVTACICIPKFTPWKQGLLLKNISWNTGCTNENVPESFNYFVQILLTIYTNYAIVSSFSFAFSPSEHGNKQPSVSVSCMYWFRITKDADNSAKVLKLYVLACIYMYKCLVV
jgi:hypothetical protein